MHPHPRELMVLLEQMCLALHLKRIDSARQVRFVLPEDNAEVILLPDAVCIYYPKNTVVESIEDISKVLHESYNSVVLAVDFKNKRYIKPIAGKLQKTWMLRALRDVVVTFIAECGGLSCAWNAQQKTQDSVRPQSDKSRQPVIFRAKLTQYSLAIPEIPY